MERLPWLIVITTKEFCYSTLANLVGTNAEWDVVAYAQSSVVFSAFSVIF